jgi:F0F1-type ATP synthase membrane subunit a
VLGPTIVTVVAFGPGREATVALAIFAASLLGLALLPADWTAVAFTRTTHELLTLLALAIVIILVVREVRLLSKGLLAAVALAAHHVRRAAARSGAAATRDSRA